MAAAALTAAKQAASISAAAQYGSTVTITETRRFAGQNVTVAREVARDSKEAQQAQQAQEQSGAAAGGKPVAGLDAVLASLDAAKKVSVLDKSRADWQGFKKADDGIEEELELHKRSGDQVCGRVNGGQWARLCAS